MHSSSGLTTPSTEAAAHSEDTRHFRLCGEVGGSDRTFPLRPGANLIGRSASCDVRLPSKGVSFRHARLTVGPASPWLEDLESKNGIFLNGSRVMSAQLAPGDELWIGSVELTLEEIDSDETRLAVDLTPQLDTDPTETAGEATPTRRRWLDAKMVERWLEAVDALATSLREPDRLQDALDRAAASLGLSAAAILELGDREGVVLAACGELGHSLTTRLRGWLGAARTAPSSILFDSSTRPGEEPLTAAVLLAAGSSPLALVLAGDFRGRAESRALLTILVRLVEQRLRPAQSSAHGTDAPTRGPALVFPAGYVPGISPAMRKLHAQMEPLADSELPTLIRGETGVGKEWVARILHHSSSRRQGPFVALNCAAVPSELLEAELFGIGKGVATGVEARSGRFLEAQGGTLFLDEIGDLPTALQPKLLRALESGEVYPVGGAAVGIDVRIIAATNTELIEHLDDRFRSDLYYRLAGVDLVVPPLRTRREDIPMLVEHTLRQVSGEARKPIRGMTVKALRRLMEYPWPGNVRELIHEVRRLVYVCPKGEAIEASHLAEHTLRDPSSPGPPEQAAGYVHDPAGTTEVPSTLSLADWLATAEDLRLAAIECAALGEALHRAGGNQVQAGRLLGISRMAVRRRLERCRQQGFSAAVDPAGG